MKGWMVATLMGTCLLSGITIGVSITAPKLPQSPPKDYAEVVFCNYKNNTVNRSMISWHNLTGDMIIHEKDTSYKSPKFAIFPNLDYTKFTVIDTETKQIVGDYSDCSKV